MRPRFPHAVEAAAVVAATAALSCAPAAGGSSGATTPTRAQSGPRVVLPSGAAISLEIAVNDQERTQGLMYRTSMAKDHGMIFLFQGLEVRPFWMKNCHFPLDMIYTLTDGTVVDVLRDVPPCKEDPCPNFPPKAAADTVVEVNAGVAPANGVAAGTKLVFLEIPGR